MADQTENTTPTPTEAAEMEETIDREEGFPQEFPQEPSARADDAEEGGASEDVPQAADIFPKFDPPVDRGSIMNELDLILEIPVQISVELGRMKITIKDLLQLAHGSVIELDTLAGDPLTVYVNGTLIAQGEVVVVNEKFGVRLTEIITPSERMKKIGR